MQMYCIVMTKVILVNSFVKDPDLQNKLRNWAENVSAENLHTHHLKTPAATKICQRILEQGGA